MPSGAAGPKKMSTEPSASFSSSLAFEARLARGTGRHRNQ
jgi:hypothetical protein